MAAPSHSKWAECFAVFTGMASVLMGHVEGKDVEAALPLDGAREGEANRYLALSEKAAVLWIDSQGPGKSLTELREVLERELDSVMRSSQGKGDFGGYLHRTSDRCIVALDR